MLFLASNLYLLGLSSFIPIILSAIASFPAFSQTDTIIRSEAVPVAETRVEAAYKLLLGGSLQQARNEANKEYSRKYFEIGFHKTITSRGPHFPPTVFTQGGSVEIAPERETIVGFKYGAWGVFSVFAFGINGIYYTDFDKGNFKIRPEIGIGAYPFKLVVGYNVPIINNAAFKKLQRSDFQITLDILLKVKTSRVEHIPYPGKES